MSHNAVVTTRIDETTKNQAIEMFFRQVIYVRGIPFDIKVPNEETVATFKSTDAGKDLHRVSGIDELAKELKA